MALQIEIRSATERCGMEDRDIGTANARPLHHGAETRRKKIAAYANEKGALIRSSAHVVEKQGKIGSGYGSV